MHTDKVSTPKSNKQAEQVFTHGDQIRINNSLTSKELQVVKRNQLYEAMLKQGLSEEEIKEFYTQTTADKNLNRLIGEKAIIVSVDIPFGSLNKELIMKTGEIVAYSPFDGDLIVMLDESVCCGNEIRKEAIKLPAENLEIQ